MSDSVSSMSWLWGSVGSFDAALYVRHIALSRWLYGSDKGFGYALGMDVVLEAT